MRAHPLSRFIGVAALIGSLVLSLPPISTAPVVAAPPESVQEAPESSDAVTVTESVGGRSESDLQLAAAPEPDAKDGPDEDRVPRDGADSGVDSVRPRGLEAPVDLQPTQDQGGEGVPERADKNEDEERDPGDGPVAKGDKKPRERVQDRADLPSRVWPMPEDSYTFTQQFGCVQQLGNLYFPGEGCPAHAPVIHTGIDLAAPEGTPFYATGSGWITLADYDRPTADANTRIIIQHDDRNEGYATDYLHWIASYVEEGDYVHAGDPIGEVGSVGYSTGPHLHFSVTDLATGEHIDPMRWLPADSRPADYLKSTQPRARLRLPAGTTAGQPESADPSPPPPPVRQDVPDSPPDDQDNGRDRSERQNDREREERRAEQSDDAAATDANRSGQKRTASEDPAADPGPDQSADEGSEKERERRRERNKDGTDAENTESGTDGGNRDRGEESSDRERRNRDTDESSGGGGKENGDDDRNTRGDGKQNDSGGRDGRNGDKGNSDGNGKDGKNGNDGRDGEDDDNGGDGTDGGDGENGENGENGGNGGNGGGGGNGGNGENGGDGGDGGNGGSGDDDGSGGDGGEGGNGGVGDAGNGGDGGDGGGGGSGNTGGSGGDGGDGGDSLSNPAGGETRGGVGGSGGSGGDSTAQSASNRSGR